MPDSKVPWSEDFPGYTPVEYEDPILKTADWADKGNPETFAGRLSFENSIDLSSLPEEARKNTTAGAPLNPRGRTGIKGRGLLGKWGANHAADPIVTRFHPVTAKLQVVVIERVDTHIWALPGGMVDPGEDVDATLRREFDEEAGNLKDEVEKQNFRDLMRELFADGKLVYRGYVDDPRNTVNPPLPTPSRCSLADHRVHRAMRISLPYLYLTLPSTSVDRLIA